MRKCRFPDLAERPSAGLRNAGLHSRGPAGMLGAHGYLHSHGPERTREATDRALSAHGTYNYAMISNSRAILIHDSVLTQASPTNQK